MIKFLLLISCLFFASCLSRFIVGTEARLQFINESGQEIHKIFLAGETERRQITPEDFVLEDGQKSRVFTTEPLGNLNPGIVQDR